MREIKFRTWRKGYPHESEFVMDYNPGLDVDWSRFPINDFFDNKLVDGGEPGEPTDYIFMQYTGLKDKNGKEIFEGDIVKGFSGNGVVEWFNNLNWDSGGSIHSGFWCKEWCEYKDDGALSYHDGFYDCEVMGNIYENPELLK